MTKEKYITDIEYEKCCKVANAFKDLERENIMVVDAGRFGFLRLLYYRYPDGFDTVIPYTNSQKLFEDLWSDWLSEQLAKMKRKNPSLMIMEEAEILESLPKDLREELINKKFYFAEQAGITVNPLIRD